MIYEPSLLAVLVFLLFVALTLGISFYFAAKTRSAKGYFAAGGGIHWFVNGIAFAGDYLSAASFLGICGMIAFYGYDGFLYSIGYLAGWIVALFVIAEPLKRLGKYTFADALDSRFNSRGIKLAAAISTLAVSIFYLIPQMVGAGVLIQPLLGFPHWLGVVLVGAVVVLIVVTAGMVSTTYVQFLKGSLLVIFSTVLTVLILHRGLIVHPERVRANRHVARPDGRVLVNGLPQGIGPDEGDLRPVGHVSKLPGGQTATGPLGPLEFLSTLQQSEVVLWTSKTERHPDGSTTTTYSPRPTPGSEVLRPGNHPVVPRPPQRFAHRQAQLPVADAGPVLRHRLAAAHPHPLLHRQGPGQRPQEHGRRHRQHRLLLRADAVHGPGRHDQRRHRRHQQQHGRPAPGPQLRRAARSRSSPPSPSPPCWARSPA